MANTVTSALLVNVGGSDRAHKMGTNLGETWQDTNKAQSTRTSANVSPPSFLRKVKREVGFSQALLHINLPLFVLSILKSPH